jgi:hypothetical protein
MGFVVQPLRLLFFVSASVFCCSSVEAYTPTLTNNGVPVRWRGSINTGFAGNPTNKSGISDQDFFSAVVKGLQRWKAASSGVVSFDYWQGTNPKEYEPNSDYNGLSSIYFASNATNNNVNISSNVLGLTQVWYNTDTGEILETDIVLNDKNYRFTTDPHDTSGYGSTAVTSESNDGRTVFIENVITHELGHAYGLSHSGGLQSTMLFMESPEQAFLGCDEQIGINALYPNHDSGDRGTITGAVVLDLDGKPVFGAHVLAISRRRGTVLATALTDRSGRYSIGALEAGSYYLMAEPFFAGSPVLPAFYSGIKSTLCNGQVYQRTFLTQEDGTQSRRISVSPGGVTEAPTISARCGGSITDGRIPNDVSTSVSAAATSSAVSTARIVYDGSRDGSGFGAIERLSTSGNAYFSLRSVSGRLEVHALGYSLYSPVDPKITILDSFGNEVALINEDNVYPGTSGFMNYDAVSIASDLPVGDYLIQVSGKTLHHSLYPAGPVSLDAVPFIFVTGSLNESEPALANSMAWNARCRMDENFEMYTSPPGPPRRSSVISQQEDGLGFCGTTSPPRSGGAGGNPPNVIGWLLPWLFMLFATKWRHEKVAHFVIGS